MGGHLGKGPDQALQVLVGVGLAQMQQVGAPEASQDWGGLAGKSGAGGAEQLVVVAKGDHADPAGGQARVAPDFGCRELGIGDHPLAAAQQRRHPGPEIERLQGALRMADRPQVVHHHHLGDGLAAQIPLRRRRKDQRRPRPAGPLRQAHLAPGQAPQPLLRPAFASAGDEAVLQALQLWQHPIGVNADARGLAQHRPVIEQQHRLGQNLLGQSLESAIDRQQIGCFTAGQREIKAVVDRVVEMDSQGQGFHLEILIWLKMID